MALLETIGGIAGAATAFGGAAWAAYSKWKQTQTDTTVGGVMQQAQIDIVATLTEQRNDAETRADKFEAKYDKAEADLDDAEEKIRTLNTQIGTLTSQLSLLKQLVDRLVTTLDNTKTQLNLLVTQTKAEVAATPTSAESPIRAA